MVSSSAFSTVFPPVCKISFLLFYSNRKAYGKIYCFYCEKFLSFKAVTHLRSRSIFLILSAPFFVSAIISSGVIWICLNELYSRIFRMSSTSNLSLTTGSLIIITFFQQNRGRINQQILISFKSCDYFYTLHCLYIDNMLKIP